MAVIPIETRPINLRFNSPQRFEPVTPTRGVVNFLYVSTAPRSTEIEYGYILLLPGYLVAGSILELPSPIKFFPKGSRILVPVPVPANAPAGLEILIAALPVSYYPGAITPESVNVLLEYDDVVNIPLPN